MEWFVSLELQALALLQVAHRNLRRWADRHAGPPPSWMTEWQEILARPWTQIAALLTERSENAASLRQSTPFAGVLSGSERKRIYDAFRA